MPHGAAVMQVQACLNRATPQVDGRGLASRRTRLRWILLCVMAAVLVLPDDHAAAHTPHDVIGALALVERPADLDPLWFIVVRGNLARSADGGRSWQFPRRGSPSAVVALTPAQGVDGTGMLYARRANGTLLRSMNDGVDWQVLDLPGAAARDVLAYPGRAGGAVLLDQAGRLWRTDSAGSNWHARPSPCDRHPCSAIAWHGDALLAAAQRQIWQQDDDTAAWHDLGTLPAGDADEESVPVRLLAAADGVVMAATADQLFVRQAAVDGWLRAASAWPLAGVTAVLHDRRRGRWLLTTAADAVLVSDDGGRQWQRSGYGLVRVQQADDYGAAHFTHLAQTGTGRLLLGGFTGLYLSDDGGALWTPIGTLDDPLLTALDVWPRPGGVRLLYGTYGSGIGVLDLQRDGAVRGVIPDIGVARSGAVRILESGVGDRQDMLVAAFRRLLRFDANAGGWRRARVAAADLQSGLGVVTSFRAGMRPAQVYAPLHGGGLLRSADGGASFERLPAVLDDAGGEQSLLALVAVADGDDEVLLASTRGGLHRSVDGGRRFLPVALPGRLRPDWLQRVGGSRPAVYAAGAAGGILRSFDAGRSWQALTLPGAAAVVAAGGFAVTHGTDGAHLLLVQSAAGPLYQAVDTPGEALRTRRVEQPPWRAFAHLHGFPRERTPMLRFSPRFSADRTVVAASGDGLYVSWNAGIDWQPVQRWQRLRPRSKRWQLRGDWQRLPGGGLASSRAGDELRMWVRGRALRVICTPSAQAGAVRIWIDDRVEASLDLRSSTGTGRARPCLQLPLDGDGRRWQRFRLQVLDRGEPASVHVDALDVLVRPGDG